MELFRNGQRALWHSGDIGAFHSAVMLLPDQNTGVFVSYNSGSDGSQSEEFLRAFFDRFFPPPDGRPGNPSFTPASAESFAGVYWPSRRSDTTWRKLIEMVDPLRVEADGRGNLTIRGLTTFDSAPRDYQRWVQVAPYVFRETSGSDTAVFQTGPRGEVTRLVIGNLPEIAFIKKPWYESPELHFSILALCLAVFISAVAAPPVTALVRRLRKQPPPQEPALAKSGPWFAAVLAALNLVFIVGLALVLVNFAGDPNDRPSALVALLILPLFATGLAVQFAFFLIYAWRRRFWDLATRLHLSLVAIVLLLFPVWLNHWNLLGLQF
jgi:hypothetical protein